MGIVLLIIACNTLAFLIGGGLLHWAYYHRRRNEAAQWKHQPRRFQTPRMMLEKLPLVLLNAVIINGALGFAVYLIVHERAQAFWDPGEHSLLYIVLSTVGLFLWYHVLLYHWHRTMHRPWLFKRIHWVHHKYKYPVWLDALYEHPLEAAWGAVVLVSPLFVFPIWAYSYFFFMAVMGAHEVLDHAGIKINIPFVATSKAHDDHHLRSNCYFGQLLPWLDVLYKSDRMTSPKRW